MPSSQQPEGRRPGATLHHMEPEGHAVWTSAGFLGACPWMEAGWGVGVWGGVHCLWEAQPWQHLL